MKPRNNDFEILNFFRVPYVLLQVQTRTRTRFTRILKVKLSGRRTLNNINCRRFQ